jgi:hypothetical protein
VGHGNVHELLCGVEHPGSVDHIVPLLCIIKPKQNFILLLYLFSFFPILFNVTRIIFFPFSFFLTWIRQILSYFYIFFFLFSILFNVTRILLPFSDSVYIMFPRAPILFTMS